MWKFIKHPSIKEVDLDTVYFWYCDERMDRKDFSIFVDRMKGLGWKIL